VSCTPLVGPDNGAITCTGSVYEDTCSFTCDDGYELTGSDTRTCQNDGNWNGTEAGCEQGIFVVQILHIDSELIKPIAYTLCLFEGGRSVISQQNISQNRKKLKIIAVFQIILKVI